MLPLMADRLRQHWTSHAAAVGLSTAQVRVLLLMKPGGAVPMRSLAAQLDQDASNFTALVDRLERRGVVERRARSRLSPRRETRGPRDPGARLAARTPPARDSSRSG